MSVLERTERERLPASVLRSKLRSTRAAGIAAGLLVEVVLIASNEKSE